MAIHKINGFIFILSLLFFSCNKEDNTTLLPGYKPLIGVWKPLTMSYDSLNVRVTHPIMYQKMVIYNDLAFEVYQNFTNNPVEKGEMQIISQNKDGLELYFAAKYPPESSFAGSHIFGMSYLILDTLTADSLVLRSTHNFYYENATFHFERL